MAFAWTTDRTERLQALLKAPERPSYSVIAGILSRESGEKLTRCAISGKVDRQGWAQLRPPPAPLPATRPKLRTKPVKKANGHHRNGHERPPTPIPPTPIVDHDIAVEQRRVLTELRPFDRICRWPVGDPGQPDFYFCGATSRADRPYCVRHCEMAYMPDRSKKDRSVQADRSPTHTHAGV